MFPACFVSVVVVALSALTVHGLATTGTPTGGVATKDTAVVAGSIEACSGDDYENCVVVQFHEDTYTALPYNNVSSVKIPNNWLCTFTEGGSMVRLIGPLSSTTSPRCHTCTSTRRPNRSSVPPLSSS
ncbi:hypothetical protein C8R47DRAFT_1171513, partial [Mycena vitilis]